MGPQMRERRLVQLDKREVKGVGIELKSKRKKNIWVNGKIVCRRRKNVRKKNQEGTQTETKLTFVPSTPLNEDLNGPTPYRLVFHPHLILIALWIEL